MKIMFYTDIHLTSHTSFPPYSSLAGDCIPLCLKNTIKGSMFIKDMIDKISPDLLINLGDVFQDIEKIPNVALYGAHKFFNNIVSSFPKDDHYILGGNHDIVSKTGSSSINSISILNGYGNVITSPDIINHTSKDGESIKIGMIPYGTSGEVFSSMRHMMNDVDIFGVHSECMGAMMESGHPADEGIPQIVGKKIFSGHIHLPQILGDWIFPGSLVQHRFVRPDLDKVGGIVVFDTSSNSVEFYPNTYSKHFVVLRDLSNFDSLDPDRCVLLTRLDLPRDTVDKMMTDRGFEYHYIPSPKQRRGDGSTVVNTDITIDQDTLLRNYIRKNEPHIEYLLDEID